MKIKIFKYFSNISTKPPPSNTPCSTIAQQELKQNAPKSEGAQTSPGRRSSVQSSAAQPSQNKLKSQSTSQQSFRCWYRWSLEQRFFAPGSSSSLAGEVSLSLCWWPADDLKNLGVGSGRDLQVSFCRTAAGKLPAWGLKLVCADSRDSHQCIIRSWSLCEIVIQLATLRHVVAPNMLVLVWSLVLQCFYKNVIQSL